jgi:hypothetical protein
MTRSLQVLAAALALAFAGHAAAQDGGSCILAGRLAEDGHWAPRFEGIELLGADGKRLTGARSVIAGAKHARLTQPALLSRCDGNNPLARADDQPPFTKAPTPALSAGVVEVESVAFPKLRSGGELVELKVRYAADRVVMLTR